MTEEDRNRGPDYRAIAWVLELMRLRVFLPQADQIYGDRCVPKMRRWAYVTRRRPSWRNPATTIPIAHRKLNRKVPGAASPTL
jgi:hypothetical protein